MHLGTAGIGTLAQSARRNWIKNWHHTNIFVGIFTVTINFSTKFLQSESLPIMVTNIRPFLSGKALGFPSPKSQGNEPCDV
jgi:hypothetical protein